MRWLAIALSIVPMSVVAEPDPAMVEILDNCLKGPTDMSNARDCIGLLAAQCMQAPDGQTTVGMMQCAMSETEAWDVLLNIEYQQARKQAQNMDADDLPDFPGYAVRAEKLLDAQRAWIAFRDANCLAAYGIYGGGSMRQIAGSQCRLRMTAERTIELRMLYDFDR